MALLAEAFVKVRPDFTGFGAELRKQLESMTPVASAAGTKVGDAWAASFRRSLAQIKRDLQNVGVADFLDLNIPPSKLYSQALILKRVLQRAGLSDLLGVNLSVSQVTEQIGKLAKESVDIPVGFDLATLPKIPGLKDLTEQFRVTGIASADQQLADFQRGLDGVAAAATAAAGKAGGGSDGGGGTGLAGMSSAAGGAARRARGFGTAWGGVFGGVAVWHIALDGVLEALISTTGALAALGIGISAVAPTFQDIATQMQNVKAIQDAMGVSLPPLTGKWQALQQALAPQAIEIFGGALNALNGQSGIFEQTAKQVVTQFDDWIARIDLWVKGNKTMQSFLQNGVVYLGQFAKILGTLAEAVANLLTKDPGLAHFLLDIVQGAADVLNWISKLPGPLITLGIALHGAYVWGGALAGVFVRLLTGVGLTDLAVKLGLASKSMETLADGTKKATVAFLGLKAIQWGFLAFIGAGFAYLVTQGDQAQKSVQNFIDSLKSNLTNLPASQEIPQIAVDIGTLNSKLHNLYSSGNIARVAQQIEHVGSISQSVGLGLHGMWSSFINLFTSRSFKDAGRALNNLFTPGGAASQAARQAISQDAKLINQAIDSLYGGYKNLATETGILMGWHDKLTMSLTRTGDKITETSHASFTYQQALTIMDLAGVKWNDTVAVMQQKVANLEAGYTALGISGTIFTNTLDAMNFASLQTQSNISKITGGFDAFFKTISGGESGFNQFVTSLQAVQTAAKATGASITGLNPQSITLRTNFIAAAQAAQTEMDNLMTLASAAGLGAGASNILAQSAKDMIAPLLGAAKGSAGLTQLLIALATQGGAQNITTFQQLAKWVGNVKDPMKNLDKQVTTLTVDAGNLTKDVQNLSTALGTTLNGAMATAIFDASGGQAAFTAFAQSVLHTKFDSDQMKTSAINLGNELITTTGSVSRAHDMFVTFAMAGLHLTKQQADLLWQQSLPSLQGAIDKLHGTTVPVKVEAAGGYTISQVKDFSTWHPFFNLAQGGLLPGWGGGDIMPAMLEPGETVVDKNRSKMLAPLFAAMRVPGYAAGGLAVLPGMMNADVRNTSNAAQAALLPVAGAADAAAALAGAKRAQQDLIAATIATRYGGGVQQWAPLVLKVLAMNETPVPPGDVGIILSQMTTESGGNPYAVNKWDSNWLAGHPSVGLMQVIAGTYAMNAAGLYGYPPPVAYGVSENPEANIFAGVHYAMSVYGQNWRNVLGHGHGYDKGGPLPPGWSMAWNGTGRSEVIAPSGLDQLISAVQENTDAIVGAIEDLQAVSAAAPQQTGAGLGNVLNGVSRSAGYSALYNTRP